MGKHIPEEMAEVFLNHEKSEEEKEREEKRTIDRPYQHDSGVILSDDLSIEEVTMNNSEKVKMLVLLDAERNVVGKIPRCFDIDGMETEENKRQVRHQETGPHGRL